MLQVADTQKPMPCGSTRPVELLQRRIARLSSVSTRARHVAKPPFCVAGVVVL